MKYIGRIILLLLVLCLILLSLNNCVKESVIEEDTKETGRGYPQHWATGDGTAENPWVNDCINKALDFVPTGGTIFLKAGYYILSTSVNVTKQVNIIGEGRNKTIIITANAFGFNINSIDYVTLKGFTIDGNAQTDGADYLSPISIGHSDYTLLEDIEVKNSGYYGICLYQCNHSLLQNIYAHNNYRHGVSSASDIKGRNMYNTYRDIYAWDNGFCGFDDRGVQAVGKIEALYNEYDNIQCWDNVRHGIAIAYISDSNLSNSLASGNGVDGIYLKCFESSTVNNCLVTLNDAEGMLLSSGVKNVNFTNVIVKNNQTGINIYNSSELVFTSCQSYDDRDVPLQAYGIALNEINSGISILNCKLLPNKYGDIYNPNGVAVEVITEKMLAKF